MFDHVDYEMPCPKCGATVTNFQTNDMGEMGKTYHVNQLGDGCFMQAHCPSCHEPLSVIVRHVTPPVIKVEVVNLEEDKIKYTKFNPDTPPMAGIQYWADLEGDAAIVESNDPNYPIVASFPCVEKQGDGSCSEAFTNAHDLSDALNSGKIELGQLNLWKILIWPGEA